MRELFARSNPIPDVDAVDVDAKAHLAELRTRSSDMRQTNPRTQPATKPTPRIRPALAGGLAVVLAVTVAWMAFTREDSGPAPDAGTLSSADLAGTWTAPSQGISALFLYLGKSGRYILSDSFGNLEKRAIETGTWTFDGKVFTFVTDPNDTTCADTVGHYRVQRLDDERIRLWPTEPDPCPDRQDGIAFGAFREYPLDPELSHQ
ncbi:MAG: hypothetical protein WB239_06485 [Acidimicrobiia bacterium]